MADVVNESVGVLNEVGQSMNPWLSRIVITILILLIGLIIGKIAGTLIRRLLNEVQLDKYVRITGFRFSVEKFIGNTVSYVIYLIAIIMSLNQLGLTKAILTILVAIIFFVIAASFLLAVKDFFPNLFAGMSIKFRRLFSEGDEIQIKEVKGKVLSIGFLETRMKTHFNEEIIIPNSLFNKRQVIVRKKAASKPKKEN